MIRSSAEDLLDGKKIILSNGEKRVPTSYEIVSDISKSMGKFISFKCGEKFWNSYELELFLGLTFLRLQNCSKEFCWLFYLKIIYLYLF